MSKARKPFWHVDEAMLRWEMTERDLAGFVLAAELTLSATVAGLPVLFGTVEDFGDGDFSRIPEGNRYIIGTIDLERADGWRVLKEGSFAVRMPKADPGSYLQVSKPDGEGHTVQRDDLVIRRAELERFEHAQGITQRPEPAAQRGAPVRFDWDRFWIEVCRVVHEDGLPRTQSELISRMSAWFDRNEPSSPDESTIKKKLKPLWHTIRIAEGAQTMLEAH